MPIGSLAHLVTYNSAERSRVLNSLAVTRPIPTTITIVDNASTDGTADHVRSRWPTVQVIESGGNLGYARANNIGIGKTSSDYVLLLNPDTVAPPGAIQTLVRGLASHPEAAIAGRGSCETVSRALVVSASHRGRAQT